MPRAPLRSMALVLAATSFGACASSGRVQELESEVSARSAALARQVARNDSLRAQVAALEAELERITGLLRRGALALP